MPHAVTRHPHTSIPTPNAPYNNFARLYPDTGDKDIAQWVPPLQSFQCTYARAWVQVKHYYALTIDTAEKTALEKLLDAC